MQVVLLVAAVLVSLAAAVVASQGILALFVALLARARSR